MRLEGRLHDWNDERGFGFIRPADGGRDLFVHISAFAQGGTRPTVGETLFYEQGQGRNGQPAAVRVSRSKAFPAVSPRRRPAAPRVAAPRQPRRSRSLLLIGIVVVASAFWLGKGPMNGPRQPEPANPVLDAPFPAEPRPRRVVETPHAPYVADVAAANDFRCDGRTRCPQMRSCEEATWFLRNCPSVQMDGDGDGIPCEEQWCRH